MRSLMSSTPIDNPYYLTPQAVQRVFDRAAGRYAEAAVVPNLVREELLARLDVVNLSPAVVLDAGVGTGASLAPLRARFADAELVGIDLSAGMLGMHTDAVPGARCVQGDLHHLPLPDASVDLVFSALALPWCHDTERVLGEFRRVLAPGGLLHLATYGPDTLKELRAAWAAVDRDIHVHYFYDMHDIGDAIMRAGLAEPVMDVDYATLTYQDTDALMADLRASGSTNCATGRSPGLTGKRKIALMSEAYERFRRDGRLPASYEIIYGQAWATRPRPQKIDADGSIGVPLENLGGRTRQNGR